MYGTVANLNVIVNLYLTMHTVVLEKRERGMEGMALAWHSMEWAVDAMIDDGDDATMQPTDATRLPLQRSSNSSDSSDSSPVQLTSLTHSLPRQIGGGGGSGGGCWAAWARGW